MTRRRLQIALGALWLLDGGLQLQPFMLGPGLARQIVAPTAAGQLYTGQATDPNTAPLLVLTAAAMLAGRRPRQAPSAA